MAKTQGWTWDMLRRVMDACTPAAANTAHSQHPWILDFVACAHPALSPEAVAATWQALQPDKHGMTPWGMFLEKHFHTLLCYGFPVPVAATCGHDTCSDWVLAQCAATRKRYVLAAATSAAPPLAFHIRTGEPVDAATATSLAGPGSKTICGIAAGGMCKQRQASSG